MGPAPPECLLGLALRAANYWRSGTCRGLRPGTSQPHDKTPHLSKTGASEYKM